MAIFNNRLGINNENKQLFIPYHHLGLFDRTFLAAQRKEGVVCAMLCVGSIEALINDVVGWYSFMGSHPIIFHENDHLANNVLKDEERQLLDKLNNNDRSRLEDKIKIFGKWDKSEELYQNLILLIKIRNGLTHLKPEELSICKETGEYTGYPKFLNNLLQNKIITKPKKAISWIESLEERNFCLWCQDISYQVIERLKEMLPETALKKQFNESIDLLFDIDEMRAKYSSLDRI